MPVIIPNRTVAHYQDNFKGVKKSPKSSRLKSLVGRLHQRAEKVSRLIDQKREYPVMAKGYSDLLGGDVVQHTSTPHGVEKRVLYRVGLGAASTAALTSSLATMGGVQMAMWGFEAGAAVTVVVGLREFFRSITYEEVLNHAKVEDFNTIKKLLEGYKKEGADLEGFYTNLSSWFEKLSTSKCPYSLEDVISAKKSHRENQSLENLKTIGDIFDVFAEVLNNEQILHVLGPKEVGVIIWTIESLPRSMQRTKLRQACDDLRVKLFIQNRIKDEDFPNIIEPHPSLFSDGRQMMGDLWQHADWMIKKGFAGDLTNADGRDFLINTISLLGHPDYGTQMRILGLHLAVLDQLDEELIPAVVEKLAEILTIAKVTKGDEMQLGDVVDKKALRDSVRILLEKRSFKDADTTALENSLI